jgi:hypothetical protein
LNNKNGLVTGVVVVMVFIGGFTLGYIVAPSDASDSASEMMDTVVSSDVDNVEPDTETQRSGTAVPEGGVTVDTAALTDGQRQLLESLGVDTDSIILTPAMVACAKTKLGTERMTAIENGDTPSFFEGTKLMACYTTT